jgi:hypothetical protein
MLIEQARPALPVPDLIRLIEPYEGNAWAKRHSISLPELVVLVRAMSPAWVVTQQERSTPRAAWTRA